MGKKTKGQQQPNQQKLNPPISQKRLAALRLIYEFVDCDENGFPRPLARGGNAKVFKVKKHGANQECALKVLTNMKSPRKERFENEIDVLEKIRDLPDGLPGVLPIIESNVSEHWYKMPLATPLWDYIAQTNAGYLDIARCVFQIADTLVKLHELGFSHRDIKPENLYYYKERYCLGDFGLVELPPRKSKAAARLTATKEQVGAYATIAPEMRWNPGKDRGKGKKADVFSLAKTLWILLTENKNGFEGVYAENDESIGLRFQKTFREKNPNAHSIELEQLLIKATSYNPEDRPTMEGFRDGLKEWIDICQDPARMRKSKWDFLFNFLFNAPAPIIAFWGDGRSVAKILNIIAQQNVNRVAFPDAVRYLQEAKFGKYKVDQKKYLRLDMTEPGNPENAFSYIMQPTSLSMGCFADNRWNYFLLEFKNMQGPFQNKNQKGNGGGAAPYSEGALLINLEDSPYNQISPTHNALSTLEFRRYMELLQREYKKINQNPNATSSVADQLEKASQYIMRQIRPGGK